MWRLSAGGDSVKIRGFWSDPEGLSIPEVLSLSFAALYITVTGVLLSRLLSGGLGPDALNFYETLTWTMLTVLGGWFGDRMVSRLGGSRLRRAQAGQAGSEDDAEGQPGGDYRGTI